MTIKHMVILSLFMALFCLGCQTTRQMPFQKHVIGVFESDVEASDGRPEQRQGIWLWRDVWTLADGHLPKVEAVEIIFCPSPESDISRCRLGLVWQGNRNMLGEIERSEGSE
jgi:hypothetical protein